MNIYYFALRFALGFLIVILGSILWLLSRIDRQKNWSPTEQDIKRERAIMDLEKKHFGRYQSYYERQSKEYKDWLRSNKPH